MIIKCKKCEIAKYTKKQPTYRGTLQSKVLLIGDAPDYTETIIGVPCIGIPGRLLDSMLNKVGIKKFCITNTIRCLPKNELGNIRQPNKTEAKNCSAKLIALGEKLPLKTVVFIGKGAERYCAKYFKDYPTFTILSPVFLMLNGAERSPHYKTNLHILRLVKKSIDS